MSRSLSRRKIIHLLIIVCLNLSLMLTATTSRHAAGKNSDLIINNANLDGNAESISLRSSGISALPGAPQLEYLPMLVKHNPISTIKTIYVDADATGTNDGRSWADAYTDLQPGMEAALAGDQVWVAAGTYMPSVEHCGTYDPRYQSFQLKNKVAVYGGFDPSVGDVEFEDRDWTANLTVLSGDIGSPEDSGDNSYHVLCNDSSTINSTSILDGFIISGGNADYFNANHGGGMLNSTSSPTLNNLTFTGNYARMGGGMYNSDASPTIDFTVFFDNSGTTGAGMYNTNASPMLTDIFFAANTTDDDTGYGGGMYNDHSLPTLNRVTFFDNSASVGGGLVNSNSNAMLLNITFSGNTSRFHGGAMANFDSSPTLLNVTFTGNISQYGGGGAIFEQTSSPNLVNCILWGDTPDEILDYSGGNAPVVIYSDVWTANGSVYPGIGNINSDPLLGLLENNGGFVITHALLSGSLAIDAGSPNPATCPSTDARGVHRPLDGNGDGVARCDMGAYEYQP